MTTQEVFEMLNTAARAEIELHKLDNFRVYANENDTVGESIFCNGRGFEYTIHLSSVGFNAITDALSQLDVIELTIDDNWSDDYGRQSFKYTYYDEGGNIIVFEVFALCKKEETDENV